MEITLKLKDEQQKIDLLTALWNASVWSPTDKLKENAANLYLDFADQFGEIDEPTRLQLKIRAFNQQSGHVTSR